jgi:alkanesulfonate monooxygenase SsuD/methylene tetrahydromethanopterin reductase-like flavin-dependent oxidoreductase (luciferase family)
MSQELRFEILILPNDRWLDVLGRAERYEALGLDTVWMADCFVDPWDPVRPWFEGWTLLAALAARTSSIRLGPLVSHMGFRNPAVLAREALTVDHISGGRLELGLGPGASGYDASMTGNVWQTPGRRVERLREAVEIIDLLLRQKTTTYTGRHFQVHEAVMNPRPIQLPRPPLTIAAAGPKTIEIAARHADVWNTEGAFPELYETGGTRDDVRRLVRERSAQLSARAAEIGRDPSEIARSFLFGFGPAPETPWASLDAFHDAVGRYREIGVSRFVFPEPAQAETEVFERVATEVISELRQKTGGSDGNPGSA